MKVLSSVVAALYAGNETRSIKRFARPNQIVSCIRRNLGSETDASWLEILEALKKENFTQEALFLGNKENVELALSLIEEGKVITLGCEVYPKLLLRAMGINAPPILWISDPSLRQLQPWSNNDGSQRVVVGAVGCRTPLSVGMAIASETGLWSASNEFLSVSGGAAGCDTAFGRAAHGAGGEVVHILPHGINFMLADQQGYGITVVCSTRYRQGGTWQGAVTALKANRPIVVADWISTRAAATIEQQAKGTYALAQRTMANLGAHPMLLNLETFRTDLPPALDESLHWAMGRNAGNINSGLFSA
jgi:hypothetical protein